MCYILYNKSLKCHYLTLASLYSVQAVVNVFSPCNSMKMFYILHKKFLKHYYLALVSSYSVQEVVNVFSPCISIKMLDILYNSFLKSHYLALGSLYSVQCTFGCKCLFVLDFQKDVLCTVQQIFEASLFNTSQLIQCTLGLQMSFHLAFPSGCVTYCTTNF